ncbi:hypothetical protein DESC_860014 [Desulfosarcina cetonica]|nr:hypothetical protein DESC_860014 [Desulfosarcina cetonica]
MALALIDRKRSTEIKQGKWRRPFGCMLVGRWKTIVRGGKRRHSHDSAMEEPIVDKTLPRPPDRAGWTRQQTV